MERQAKRTKAGVYLHIRKKYEGLAVHYARRYASIMGQTIFWEDIRNEIIYDMMEVYEKYLLTFRSNRELECLLKVVPIYFWHQKLDRLKNKKQQEVDAVLVEDVDRFVYLYDEYYDKIIASMPADNDEELLLKMLIRGTDKLKEASKGLLSKSSIERFFKRYHGWTRPRFFKAWENAGSVLRLVG
jgi:hypothetical protein